MAYLLFAINGEGVEKRIKCFKTESGALRHAHKNYDGFYCRITEVE